MTKKTMTPKHIIWCNFNTFGAVMGDAIKMRKNHLYGMRLTYGQWSFQKKKHLINGYLKSDDGEIGHCYVLHRTNCYFFLN